MAEKVISKIAREKMALARFNGTAIAKITHIALGSGGVNANGEVILLSEANTALNNEVVRKEYASAIKKTDTSYEYTIKLEKNEHVGIYFSELALIDSDGDIVALLNFLAQGKDETEATYSLEDIY